MLNSLVSYTEAEKMHNNWKNEDRFLVYQLTKESSMKVYRYVGKNFLEPSEDCLNHHRVSEVGRQSAFYASIDNQIPSTQQWLRSFDFDNSHVICIYDPHYAISIQWSVFCEYWHEFIEDSFILVSVNERWILVYYRQQLILGVMNPPSTVTHSSGSY